MSALGLGGCLNQFWGFIMGILAMFGLLGLFGLQQPVDPPPPPTMDFSTPIPLFTPTPVITSTPISSGQRAVVGTNFGRIEVGGGEVWDYEGTAGEVLTIEVRADAPANDTQEEERIAQGLLDTYLYLYDPNGLMIFQADDIRSGIETDTQLSEITLDTSGIYRMEVRSWDNQGGGTYTLTIKSSLAE